MSDVSAPVATLKTFRVEVRVTVGVTVDESKFTPEFLAEFAGCISDYDFNEHIEHLAWLHACRDVDERSFIEGYGPAKDFGISFTDEDTETEILS